VSEEQTFGEPVPVTKHKEPLYPQLLQLKHVHPNAWQRALLGEGMAVLGGLLALADVASAWSIVVLPVAMAVVVKAHDVLAGVLAHDEPADAQTR
jgi:hypothetical protein